MTSSSTSSARFPRFSTHGVPTRCWCGEGITTFGYSTVENRYRRFYRCEIARDRKTENHLFKWIDEALIKEIRMVDAKHERVALGITKFEERVMEKEMKQKLKIATVAMVVVGAIVGIWTSLTV
ncbi:unnamed protein product [Brassica oleracea var. botrytis]|uniref:(rape) hypothetical protein n=1 Tax=Brassica napus TaxID=3708 RepID=A0A816IV78_BRANA|nr:unnamed protein product [Brassica napus]